MTKQELKDFINTHQNEIGTFNIIFNKKFWGQFTLGYYYDEETKKYKVYEVSERQEVWIRDEFENESDAIERLYRLVKTTFWIE